MTNQHFIRSIYFHLLEIYCYIVGYLYGTDAFQKISFKRINFYFCELKKWIKSESLNFLNIRTCCWFSLCHPCSASTADPWCSSILNPVEQSCSIQSFCERIEVRNASTSQSRRSYWSFRISPNWLSWNCWTVVVQCCPKGSWQIYLCRCGYACGCIPMRESIRVWLYRPWNNLGQGTHIACLQPFQAGNCNQSYSP